MATSSIRSSDPRCIFSLQVNSRSTIPLQQHASHNKYQIYLKYFTFCASNPPVAIPQRCAASTRHVSDTLEKKMALTQQEGCICPVPTCQNKSGETSSSPLDLKKSSVYYLGKASHNLGTIVLWLKRVKWVEKVSYTYYIFLKATYFSSYIMAFPALWNERSCPKFTG